MKSLAVCRASPAATGWLALALLGLVLASVCLRPAARGGAGGETAAPSVDPVAGGA